MNARFMVEDPDSIVFTMKITMTAKQWTDLRDTLTKVYPSSELSNTITSLLIDARKVFYKKEEPA